MCPFNCAHCLSSPIASSRPADPCGPFRRRLCHGGQQPGNGRLHDPALHLGGLQGGAIDPPRDPTPPNLVLTPDGTPLGSQQLFADGITPSIAGLADGGLVIAWFAQRSVNAQRFGPDGSPLGPIVNLTSTAAAAPSVVALPWGGFLIGWPTVTDGKPKDLMRFFDAQGLLGN